MLRSTNTLRTILYSIVLTLAALTQVAAHDELPLVISVCSFNCAPWVQINLDKIFSQEYSNFRVVYVDDGSSDDTVYLVEEYVRLHNLQDKVTLIANHERVGKMKNIYNVFHSCDDNEIIIQIDADDWLPTTTIFKRINEVYQSGDVWLTYSDFDVYPEGTKEWCTPMKVPDHILKKRAYRHWKWVFTHMRTFYAWLFKSVKLEDFITEMSPGFDGKFFPICNDMAAYFPMLEMCGPNYTFIPEKLYVYNRDNPNLGAKLLGHLYKPVGEDIRKRDKYPMLEEPRLSHAQDIGTAKADVIILSTGDVEALEKLLHSMSEYVTGTASITVLYQKNKKAMRACAQHHPDITFTKVTDTTVNNALKLCVLQGYSNHVLIARDTIFVQQPLDLTASIKELETTQAHAFYHGFTPTSAPFYCAQTRTEIVPHQHVWNDTYTWKFRTAPAQLSNVLDMTLFPKQKLLERLRAVPEAKTMYYFLDIWHDTIVANHHEVGLFTKEPLLGGSLNATHSLINRTVHVPTHINMKEYIDMILSQQEHASISRSSTEKYKNALLEQHMRDTY